MFFFFKQKTAYEMRISDWSSDVCSSDLPADFTLSRRGPLRARNAAGREAARRRARDPRTGHDAFRDRRCGGQCRLDDLDRRKHFRQPAHRQRLFPQQRTHRFRPRADEGWRTDRRSEEHTSELQSLMRISYAVFCLKKNTKTKKQKSQICIKM